VAVVGAGLAGLSCAYDLAQAGANVRVYEAHWRLGGRVLTVRDEPIGGGGKGPAIDLGGSFINSDHHAIRRLAERLSVRMVDLHGVGDELEDRVFIGGKRRVQERVDAAVAPIIRRVGKDAARIARDGGLRGATARAIDRMSLAAYLDKLGVTGWVRAWIEAVYVSELGLDAGDLSALNLVQMLHGEGDDADLAGGSDERYRLQGGMGALTDKLAAGLSGRIHTDSELVRIRSAAGAVELSFRGHRGAPDRTEKADFAVLTLPFSVLRKVDLDMALPPLKKRAIDTLGYGTNAKLILGFKHAVWRQAGDSGAATTDTNLGTTWDAAPLHKGPGAALTVYLGGKLGAALGEGGPEADADERTAALGKLFPGAVKARNDRQIHAPWPRFRWSRGSYSCYRPGQLTTTHGHEGGNVGAVYFAGEHCSAAHQGFMNGAVETGQAAAAGILAKLGSRS